MVRWIIWIAEEAFVTFLTFLPSSVFERWLYRETESVTTDELSEQIEALAQQVQEIHELLEEAGSDMGNITTGV